MTNGHADFDKKGSFIFFVKDCLWKLVHCPFELSEYFSKKVRSVSQEAAGLDSLSLIAPSEHFRRMQSLSDLMFCAGGGVYTVDDHPVRFLVSSPGYLWLFFFCEIGL